MQQRPFGSTGRMIPVTGQGSWQMERDSRAAAIDALRHGVALGLTHIDTAEMYGNGAAEEIIADALGSERDRLFLVSKVLPQNASRAGVHKACERSLKRLKTDRLDCYLLHWRGPHPLAETIAGFEDLMREGKILSWGVSNFDTDDLDEALAIAGPGRIACNQVLYHLGERAIEHAVLPWCERHGVTVTAYSPFGQGRFPDAASRGGRVLAEIAARHDGTPRQVALAFVTRRPALIAIPKSARAAHVEENAGVSGLMLSGDDVAAIDAVFPVGRTRGLPVL